MTVGAALGSLGVRTGEADLVMPPANAALTAGAHVYIRHATGVRLVVGGHEQSVKTHAATVADVLAESGVALEQLDRVVPRRTRLVEDGMTIKVTTVRDVIEATDEVIPYTSVTQYDSELPEDQQELTQGGWDGAIRREYRVRRVNGKEVRRALIGETVTLPQDEIITIGTYVAPAAPAPRPVVASAVATPAPAANPACPRTLNVYATWYTAASAGGSGVTATGTGVYKGIIAVDPRVIPLGTRMYIPGYGYGTAADTGGAIMGDIIDLGYGANDVMDWTPRRLDICIL
jgi:3D (Asp-Asp-Asp) domain-containing protein